VKARRARDRENIRFRALKDASGMTDRAIADLLGVSKVTVRSWLRGYREVSYRRMPAPMLKLAEALLKERHDEAH
jgi:transposase